MEDFTEQRAKILTVMSKLQAAHREYEHLLEVSNTPDIKNLWNLSGDAVVSYRREYQITYGEEVAFRKAMRGN
jgi:hypothetical protein